MTAPAMSARARQSIAPIGQNERPQSVCASTLASSKAPPRNFVVSGLIPDRTVTLLSGDGGVGKSLLALHLAANVTCGRPWLDLNTYPGGVVFVSAEDELIEIHRRLEGICAFEGIDLASLTELHFIPLAGKDALLAVPDRTRGVMSKTPLFDYLFTTLGAIRPKLLILDTLADIFGGSEIDRAQARSFIGLFRGLAIDFDLAVLLLAHPSLAGMSSGSGSSGSTGWSNSVRSRLYLERKKKENKDDDEPDPDERVLSVRKSNYGPTGTRLSLRWRDGVIVRDDEDEIEAAHEARASAAEAKFLELLRLHTEQGIRLSASPSANYAPRIFERHQQSAGFKQKAFAKVMHQLLEVGALHVATVGSNSRKRQQLAEGPGPKTASTNALPT